MSDLINLEKKIAVDFKNKALFKEALTHRSYLNENPNRGLSHNERLEFLGDAVLELIVTEYLFRNYPTKPEGELTAFRAALVNYQMLAKIAKEIDLGKFILLSRGEAKDTSRAREVILANTFEALIGAMYLDQGLEKSKKFIIKNVLKELPQIIEQGLFKDAKSLFQELAQEKLGVTPTYNVLSETGPDHNKIFRVGVFLNSDLIAEGEGPSKQEAELEAAKNAIRVKGW